MAGKRRRYSWGSIVPVKTGYRVRHPCREHMPTKTESAGVYGTKTAAERVLVQLRAAHERGESICSARAEQDAADDERACFRYWAERWLADGGSRGSGFTPKTLHEYRALLDRRVLPRWGEVDVREIRRGALQEWVRELSREGGSRGQSLSASQVRQAYHLVSGVLLHALTEDYLEASPAVGVRVPALPKGKRPDDPSKRLPAAYAERLAAELPGPMRPLPLLAYYCGLRLAEARALRRRDVDAARCRLEVAGKGGVAATVAVPPSVAQVLGRHLAEHVGPGPDARRAGLLTFTRHDLRAAGESAVADKLGPAAAARWARHDVAVALRHYQVVDPAEAARAAATLDALRDEATSGEPEP